MSIPQEAIEAAAKASYEEANYGHPWEHATEEWKASYRNVATAALEAAAPRLGATQERERLMRKLDAETISHQDRGQIAVRQWARAWINEQGAE